MSDDYRHSLESNQKSRAPRNVLEVEVFLNAIFDARTEMRGWIHSPSTNAIEANLNLLCQTQLPPLFLVPKNGKGPQLKSQLDHILLNCSNGFPPSTADAERVWDLLDQTGSVR